MSLPEHPEGGLRSGNIADELAQGQRNLEVVVVSPARPIFEGQAHWVTLPTRHRGRPSDGLYAAKGPERSIVGQIGIWPRHAPLVAAIGSGLLRIGQGGDQVARFAVRGGFLKVGDDKVTILVDHAVAEASASGADAQAELDETVAALRHAKSDDEFGDLLDRRAWGEAQLKLAGA